MATDTSIPSSNIDELLTGTKNNTQPATPESSYADNEADKADTLQLDEPETGDNNATDEESDTEDKADIEADIEADKADVDDYGNETPKKEPKTYTEEEVNERINRAVRDRLARLEKNQGITPQQAEHAAQNFEYDANADGDWQQQLKQFVKQTYQETIREQQQQEQSFREQQLQAEFEAKFHNGMGKFADFRDVVGNQPITDAMTVATRAMKDPAAFLYAASKRHGQELQRISQIPDQYTQMVEMGRLEERMRKNKSPSNAPRPISRSKEDGQLKHKEDREPTIEELIAKSEAKKRAIMNARRR